MPLVINSTLPCFQRLAKEGATVLSKEQACHQDIRELHVGLLNMMPDQALEATERQFFRLVGESNQIAQFYMHPFTLRELERGSHGQAHIDQHYQSVDEIKEEGLDALIITGANVVGSELSDQVFWEPLSKVIEWAYEHVTSTLCSCLATHAVLQRRYGQQRRPLMKKRWGVYPHRVSDRTHPLVSGVNTRFDVPHSRFNEVTRIQFMASGLDVLVESLNGEVHLAVSEDGFRLIFFQGHPEYDTISLFKEYKREIGRFIKGECVDYPLFPEHYFNVRIQAMLDEYRGSVYRALGHGHDIPEFPEDLIVPELDNTWHDTAESVINNWIGKVYQITHLDRTEPFRPGIDRKNPIGRL